jgi:hypothetical protein
LQQQNDSILQEEIEPVVRNSPAQRAATKPSSVRNSPSPFKKPPSVRNSKADSDWDLFQSSDKK